MRIVHWTRLLVVALVLFGLSQRSFAQVSFGAAITFGPPELPVYEQPLCPEEGYIWTPGYWAWDDDSGDYYWVPGTWVQAPQVGYLWTPPYWGWGGDRFVFYDGYWGREVGFYGGINYGFGYGGRGYEGGRWDNDRFFYNRSVNNINVTNIHNVYNTTVINNNTTNETRVSYNGHGGVNAQPTSQEQAVAHQQHIPPPAPQQQHIQAARSNPQLRASANQGKPPVAATPRPGAFNDRAVVAAKVGGHYTPPPNRGGNANSNGANNNANRPNNPGNNNNARSDNNANRPPNASRSDNNNANRPPDASRPANIVHPRDLPPPTRATPNTGNPKTDQRYQQQQDRLLQKQDQERQKIQAKQDQEHQRLTQQKANDARTQQLEQHHQQQTQQLQQKHDTQQQKLQQKYTPPPSRQAPPPQEKKPQH